MGKAIQLVRVIRIRARIRVNPIIAHQSSKLLIYIRLIPTCIAVLYVQYFPSATRSTGTFS
jgi:hypothetical protein